MFKLVYVLESVDKSLPKSGNHSNETHRARRSCGVVLIILCKIVLTFESRWPMESKSMIIRQLKT